MSVSKITYGSQKALRPLALSVAMVLGIAICRAENAGESTASGAAPGMGAAAILRDWRKDTIANIEYSANKLDGQRVMRGDAARADVFLQAARVREVARRDGVIAQIPAVDRRGAERVYAEIARHAHGQRREEHEDHARIDR